MRSCFGLGLTCVLLFPLLGVSGFACSAPAPDNETPGGGGSGTAGHSGNAPSAGGTLAAASGSPATGGVASAVGGAGAASGGSPASSAGSGGHSGAGVAGMSVGGAQAGTSSGGSAGTTSGGSGGSSSAALCATIKAEYAAELEKQLECKPGAGSQCANRAAAAPGCECRVFIQPADPFAIEHLSNVANGWFDEDCSMPSCPAKCSTAATGTCQADAKSSLGGRCVTP